MMFDVVSWLWKPNFVIFLKPPHYTNSQNSMVSFYYNWFLAKNLSNLVSLSWKLHNRYCHYTRGNENAVYQFKTRASSCLIVVSIVTSLLSWILWLKVYKVYEDNKRNQIFETVQDKNLTRKQSLMDENQEVQDQNNQNMVKIWKTTINFIPNFMKKENDKETRLTYL